MVLWPLGFEISAMKGQREKGRVERILLEHVIGAYALVIGGKVLSESSLGNSKSERKFF